MLLCPHGVGKSKQEPLAFTCWRFFLVKLNDPVWGIVE